MNKIETTYYNLIERKATKLEIASILAQEISGTNNLERLFAAFYNQFFFMEKYAETIEEKLRLLLRVKNVFIENYIGNDTFCFLFGERLTIILADSTMKKLPISLKRLLDIESFRFRSSSFIIDEEFCESFPVLKELSIKDIWFDTKNSISILTLLSKIHIQNSLDIDIDIEEALPLIANYTELEKLCIHHSGSIKIPTAFYLNFPKLKSIYLSETFETIPESFYDLENLEIVIFDIYSGNDLDMKFLRKKSLKQFNTSILNIPYSRLEEIKQLVPSSLELIL
jgi:hypothetical protein